MESVNCIICGSDNNSIYKKIKDKLNPLFVFNIVKCNCGFIYLNPRPDSNEISKYYNNSYLPYSKEKAVLVYIYRIIRKITFFWKYKMLLRFNSSFRDLLDYGGGTGDFSSYLINKNISAVNYDPHTVDDMDLADSSLKKKFDIITLWHSIEHMHDLVKTFDEISFLLKEKGFLFIAIPNHDAYERKFFFRDTWIAYDPPRHLYHFNSQTFKKILKKNKFIIENSYRMYQDTFFNILMSSTSRNPVKLFYQILKSIIYIYRNKNFSSSLLFVSRKQ